MSRPANRPSHRVYAVTKAGERNFWNPIGAAWAHSDGEGFNLKLAYLPLNGAEIVDSQAEGRRDRCYGNRLSQKGPPTAAPRFLEINRMIEAYQLIPTALATSCSPRTRVALS